jgi:hypothetical protein
MRLLPPAVAIVIGGIFLGRTLTNRDETEKPPNLAACNCDHESQQKILDRQRQVEALINKINEEMNAQDANEMYTDELYSKFRKDNLKLLNDLNQDFELSPTGGGGTTDPYTCTTRVPQGTSACVQGSFQAHENVHHRECLAYWKRTTNRFSDYKKAKTMVQYWQEDLEAYQEELKFLKAAFSLAVADCTGNYPGAESKEEQQQRLAGSKRRLTQYVTALS